MAVTELEVGQNRATLQQLHTDKAATPVAQALIPKDAPEAKWGSATKTGDATWTTHVVTHGLTAAPTTVQLTPTSAAASAAAWVSAKTATTFTITFAAAPANAAVASWDYQANI
jgi:hypothetical protein